VRLEFNYRDRISDSIVLVAEMNCHEASEKYPSLLDKRRKSGGWAAIDTGREFSIVFCRRTAPTRDEGPFSIKTVW
jgi:hypothetical protein